MATLIGEEKQQQQQLHIVMFPWLAFGHLIPFVNLSQSLASKGHKISFLSTPRNLSRLPTIPPHLSHLITRIPLPTLSSPNLPSDAESTTDIPPNVVEHLKLAFDTILPAPFSDFLSNSSPKPDWVVLDFTHHWAPPIARQHGVSSAYFSVFLASVLAFFGQPSVEPLRSPEEMTVSPPWVTFPSSIAYRLYEAKGFASASSYANASGVSDLQRYATTINGCDAVLVRTCNEYESRWVDLLREHIYKKPVVPVGFLPPREEEILEISETGMTPFRFLDEQKHRSVLYVALGSEAVLSVDQVHQLALGLEKSGVPFLWALRWPVALPEGFEERITKARGMVTMGMVPQMAILRHESVGGFLTHVGWSSVVEAMQRGMPLVMLPIFADQGLNARVVVEKEVGVEVPRNEEDGEFTADGVAMAVREVMVEKFEDFTAKAMDMKKVCADLELHDRYIDQLGDFFRDNRGT